MCETLCLDTIKKNIIPKYTDSNIYPNTRDCRRIFNNWVDSIKNSENKFKTHTFEIINTGDYPLENNKLIRGAYFTHAFSIYIIDLNHIIFCDSWQSIHTYNCRANLFTFDELCELINEIYDSIDRGFIEKIKLFDKFFNDDNQTNWRNDFDKLKQEGEIAIEYNLDELIVFPNMINITSKLIIQSYEEIL